MHLDKLSQSLFSMLAVLLPDLQRKVTRKGVFHLYISHVIDLEYNLRNMPHII